MTYNRHSLYHHYNTWNNAICVLFRHIILNEANHNHQCHIPSHGTSRPLALFLHLFPCTDSGSMWKCLCACAHINTVKSQSLWTSIFRILPFCDWLQYHMAGKVASPHYCYCAEHAHMSHALDYSCIFFFLRLFYILVSGISEVLGTKKMFYTENVFWYSSWVYWSQLLMNIRTLLYLILLRTYSTILLSSHLIHTYIMTRSSHQILFGWWNSEEWDGQGM